MRFSEFAQILFSVVGGRKYLFTIDLLKGGLNANGIDYINSLRSDEAGKSRIRKLFSGKNDITEIAPEIVNDYSQNLFVDYILETIDESDYPKLCEKFRQEPFNIIFDKVDVPQILSEIYEDILKSAAKGKSVKKKSSVNKNVISNIYSYDLDGETACIIKIDNIISNLIDIGRKLAEFRITGIADDVRYRNLRTALHNEFEQLTTLSKLLFERNKTWNNLSIEDIIDSIMSLEENSFILTTDEYRIESTKNYHIHRLNKLLSQSKQN